MALALHPSKVIGKVKKLISTLKNKIREQNKMK
jgi:hypothetical protein